MTFQSSPYLPWIFPDQAYRMNKQPKEYMVGRLMGAPIEPQEVAVPYQVEFADHARRVALDRVENTKKAQMGMEGRVNTTARSQRYDRPASRSAVPNGVFPGNEYHTSGNAFRGGVITTKEGREWLAQRLLQRRDEYAQRSTGNFSAGPPKKIDLSPYTEVDTLLQSLFSDFYSGSFSAKVNESLNKLLSAFISIGATVTDRQMAEYSRAVAKLSEATTPYAGPRHAREEGFAYSPAEKRFRSLDSINETLRLIQAAVSEINRLIYEPQAAREQAMGALRQRLLSAQIGEFTTPYSAERARNIAEYEREGEGPVMGQRPPPPPGMEPEQLLPSREFEPAPAGAGRRRKVHYKKL